MEYTLQFAWQTKKDDVKLLTLKIPPGPVPRPYVEIHPCSLTLPHLHELMLAAQDCERVAALQFPGLNLETN